MIESKVSLRYAKSLIDSVDPLGSSELILKDFAHIKYTIKQSRELAALFNSPIVQNWKKKKIFKEIFESSISKITFDFLMLLTDKHREKLLFSIITQFENLYNQRHNKMSVKISSAIELDDIIKQKVLLKVTKFINKEVIADFIVIPELKGGIQIQIEDWVYDASLSNKLAVLRKELIQGKSI